MPIEKNIHPLTLECRGGVDAIEEGSPNRRRLDDAQRGFELLERRCIAAFDEHIPALSQPLNAGTPASILQIDSSFLAFKHEPQAEVQSEIGASVPRGVSGLRYRFRTDSGAGAISQRRHQANGIEVGGLFVIAAIRKNLGGISLHRLPIALRLL
ncbi:hypothetical protein Busp01_01480 [Trinickia caryophylli]|nr:hypothetical protein Busp01_01480 [Trinickia caryophylli]